MTKRIVFDAKVKRPACVLLQAALGGDIHVARRFPAESWLISPTPDMKLYSATDEQIELLVAMVKGEVQT